ncbi:MAG: hypothetical protein KF764_15120 [Labilithrix sp.]|nr:hypothetical protein [Labilithrix sp.]MBX3224954.1 hypothetical protein [Labilithrix sp.]
MIEAVIVISTMVVFMGTIAWTRQAYGAKLDYQQRTRSDVLYYASHGCKESGGGVGSPGGGGTAGLGPTGGENAANRAPTPDKAAINQSWNSAAGSLKTTVTGKAIIDQNARGGNGGSIQYGPLSLVSNVSADSYSTCNEPDYGSQFVAWFNFGLNFVTSGGGVVDIFR